MMAVENKNTYSQPNHQEKENNDNSSEEKSHWEKYHLYYLIFGSFFFTTLIIFIINWNTNNKIRSVTWQRYNYSPPISSDSSNNEIDEILRTINQKGGKLSGGVQASRFEKPDPNRQNEDWVEKTIIQQGVKKRVKNWLNGFKFLSQYQTKKGLELDNHVLFCGPPGSGKSFTIEEFCHNETSYFVKAHFESQIWVGSSIEKQQHVFNSAKELVKENAKRGETKPVAIVIEEIDAVGTKDLSGHNTSSKSEVDGLLKIFDEINEKKLNIVVVATTNNPEVLNDALVRPGRLGRRIYVNYPTGEELRKLTDYLQEVMEKSWKTHLNEDLWKEKEKEKEKEKVVEWPKDYWDNVYQSIQKNATRFQKKQMGLNFRDLQKAVTGSLEAGVAENNPKIIPAASVFHEELKDVLQTRVNDHNNNLRRQNHLPPIYDDTNEEEREPSPNY
ncbi:MAG: hypothetical protein MRERV_5c024 [Mycoplasmataceae bacterium RV_VA103A]|nr:MAG: hypothetical protein MRERV_5c024 [Mycoplasmataceae bacterium RV_VA103A]